MPNRLPIVIVILATSVFHRAIPGQSCTGLPSGAVSWWPGQSSTSDALGANHGSLIGGATFAPGIVGQSFSFDGVDDWFQTTSPPTNIDLSDAFSIEFWLRTTSTNAFVPLFRYYDSSTETGIVCFLLGSLSYGVRCDIYAPYPTDWILLTSGPKLLNDGAFHHIAITKDTSGTCLLTVDGVLQTMPIESPSTAPRGNILLGDATAHGQLFTLGYDPGATLAGQLDEFTYYSRALSAPEISSIFNAAGAGKCGDTDGDSIPDEVDNCPGALNSDQLDTDGDLQGDVCDLDDDNDALSDEVEALVSTDPKNPDTDSDGLLDGSEVETADGSGCPDPVNADSDGDSLPDGSEITNGTNPCSDDTDGDGVLDGLDPLPTEPGVTSGFIEDVLRQASEETEALDISLIAANNANAAAGKRNALANKASEAANAVNLGDIEGAIELLTTLLQKIDGHPSPPDWIEDSPEKEDLANEILLLIALLTLAQ